jgi:hypothetical protein
MGLRIFSKGARSKANRHHTTHASTHILKGSNTVLTVILLGLKHSSEEYW